MAETIDTYIARFPQEIRELLELVRHTVSTAAPGAEEAIKYQMPTFVYKGNLVHFAAFKQHIGFYPAPRADHPEFAPELAGYKTGKGSIQFPYSKPLPVDLITRIVKWRVAAHGG